MDLFIRPDVQLEKTAASVDLPEDPNAWPKEVLDELYKQVPYISDFHPNVVMDRVDAERAYGLGHVEVSNQAQAQMDGAGDQMMQATGMRMVRVPIVIKDGKLSPFDLLLNDAGKVLPLTESRLRQALFRPQMFDVTSNTPGDQSMIGQLYPPQRTAGGGFGMGGMTTPAESMGKMGSALEEFLLQEKGAGVAGVVKNVLPKGVASPIGAGLAAGGVAYGAGKVYDKLKGDFGNKTASALVTFSRPRSILEKVASTLLSSDLDTFWTTLQADQGLQLQMHKNAEAVTGPLGVLAAARPATLEKRAHAFASLVAPSVTQVARKDGGYAVKTASHLFWKPTTRIVDRGELIQCYGEKVAFAADTAGAATLAEGADTETGGGETSYAPILEAGVYEVSDTDGKKLLGVVIPHLLDLDGVALPLTLFTNGSQATVQSEILGNRVGDATKMPTGAPEGTGFFFEVSPEGMRALLPMTLSSSFSQPGEPATSVGETYDGRPVEVSVMPNLQQVTSGGDGRVLLPAAWRWASMEGAEEVALRGSEENFGDADLGPDPEKQASVTIHGGDGTFSIRGPAVEKLAWDEREAVDLDQAMFLLGALGVHQGIGVEKLARATNGARPMLVQIGRHITPAEEALEGARKEAQARGTEALRLKRNLVKEASVISDPQAVDTVLSLGFINDENLMNFVSFLPTIDDSQMKMCELLLGARLGLPGVSNTALERAVRLTEEVIEGLKVLAFQE